MAVADQEVRAQRRPKAITPDSVRLRPGQYLIRTPDNYEVTKDRHGAEQRTLRMYNGSAYGVRFENNVAIIDDESVREIREVLLGELEGDTDKLPPWFRDPNGSAEALARALQSDFHYEVTPELVKLRRLTKQQIAAGNADNPRDELTIERTATHATTTGRALPGVDDDGDAEGREGMPAQPRERKPARGRKH
jgi:hypothetical protein